MEWDNAPNDGGEDLEEDEEYVPHIEEAWFSRELAKPAVKVDPAAIFVRLTRSRLGRDFSNIWFDVWEWASALEKIGFLKALYDLRANDEEDEEDEKVEWWDLIDAAISNDELETAAFLYSKGHASRTAVIAALNVRPFLGRLRDLFGRIPQILEDDSNVFEEVSAAIGQNKEIAAQLLLNATFEGAENPRLAAFVDPQQNEDIVNLRSSLATAVEKGWWEAVVLPYLEFQDAAYRRYPPQFVVETEEFRKAMRTRRSSPEHATVPRALIARLDAAMDAAMAAATGPLWPPPAPSAGAIRLRGNYIYLGGTTTTQEEEQGLDDVDGDQEEKGNGGGAPPQPNGIGTAWRPSGTRFYSGHWLNGQANGLGARWSERGDFVERRGTFKNGELVFGSMHLDVDRIKCHGEWKGGVIWDGWCNEPKGRVFQGKLLREPPAEREEAKEEEQQPAAAGNEQAELRTRMLQTLQSRKRQRLSASGGGDGFEAEAVDSRSRSRSSSSSKKEVKRAVLDYCRWLMRRSPASLRQLASDHLIAVSEGSTTEGLCKALSRRFMMSIVAPPPNSSSPASSRRCFEEGDIATLEEFTATDDIITILFEPGAERGNCFLRSSFLSLQTVKDVSPELHVSRRFNDASNDARDQRNYVGVPKRNGYFTLTAMHVVANTAPNRFYRAVKVDTVFIGHNFRSRQNVYTLQPIDEAEIGGGGGGGGGGGDSDSVAVALAINLLRKARTAATSFHGVPITEILGLIYLAKEYPNVCVPVAPFPEGTLLSDVGPADYALHWSCSTTSRSSSSNNNAECTRQLLEPRQFKELFTRCLATAAGSGSGSGNEESKTRFVIVILSMVDQDVGRRGVEDNGHTNMLIVDKVARTVERFEPHGSGLDQAYDSDQLDARLRDYFHSQYSLAYVPPLDFCPYLGFQRLDAEGQTEAGDPEGFCSAWSQYWAALRLSNPGVDRQQLMNRAMQQLGNDDQSSFQQGSSFREFIRNYAEFIYRQTMRILDSAQAQTDAEALQELNRQLTLLPSLLRMS